MSTRPMNPTQSQHAIPETLVSAEDKISNLINLLSFGIQATQAEAYMQMDPYALNAYLTSISEIARNLLDDISKAKKTMKGHSQEHATHKCNASHEEYDHRFTSDLDDLHQASTQLKKTVKMLNKTGKRINGAARSKICDKTNKV